MIWDDYLYLATAHAGAFWRCGYYAIPIFGARGCGFFFFFFFFFFFLVICRQ